MKSLRLAFSPAVRLCRIVCLYWHALTTTKMMLFPAWTLRRKGLLIFCPFLAKYMVRVSKLLLTNCVQAHDDCLKVLPHINLYLSTRQPRTIGSPDHMNSQFLEINSVLQDQNIFPKNPQKIIEWQRRARPAYPLKSEAEPGCPFLHFATHSPGRHVVRLSFERRGRALPGPPLLFTLNEHYENSLVNRTNDCDLYVFTSRHVPFTPARLILRSLLWSQTLRGLNPQNNPARTPQEPRNWRNPEKMDKCQLCSVRKFGHRAGRSQMPQTCASRAI